MQFEDGRAERPGTSVRVLDVRRECVCHRLQEPTIRPHSFGSIFRHWPGPPPPPRRHVFGAKGDVRANVHYLDETTVLYAAGNQIVLHHVESNTQRFVPGAPDAEGITALALSPNRKFLAIAERGEKATISVLDLTTHAKRRKVLSSAEVNAKVRRRRDAVPGLI